MALTAAVSEAGKAGGTRRRELEVGCTDVPKKGSLKIIKQKFQGSKGTVSIVPKITVLNFFFNNFLGLFNFTLCVLV